MASALKYIKNIGKSVTYASMDVFKEMNPVFNDFAQTNGELAGDMYKAIKNIKKNAKDIPSKVMNSKYGEFGRTAIDNIFDDIKSGKLYNKDRIEQYETEAMESMMDDGFDFGDDDDIGFSSLDSSDNNDLDMMDMMDNVGEKSSTAISTAVARSAEYMVKAHTESSKVMYKQMNSIYGGLHSGMSTINQNISKVIEFSNGPVTTHFENSRTFYQEITRLDQERNEYLKQILEEVKSANSTPKSNPNYKKNTYSDLTTSEGNVDLSNYFEYIKKNAKNSGGGIFDMLGMLDDMGGIKNLAASPLQGVLTAVISKAVPKILKNSMESINKSVSGLFANALLKLKDKSNSSFGGIWSTLQSLFGIDTSFKRIDPSRYEKGKIPFDGVTKKAITEVIPTYLSKILAALQGGSESRFNYDSGKFVTIDELKESFNNMEKTAAKFAASELSDIINSSKSSLSFRDKSQEKQFDQDWDAMVQWMFNCFN